VTSPEIDQLSGLPDALPASGAPLALLGLPQAELAATLGALGEKPYRARQLMRWFYGRLVTDPAAMTDISAALRTRLAEQADLRLPVVDACQESADGTVKWRLAAGDGQLIETVFIPEEGRGTLCVSSQVGCALDCSFCATGRQGFNRNLSASEIIGQVILASSALGLVAGRSRVTNVVFMGMGEPLANFKAVVQACHVLVDDFGFQLSRRRVTVSTSGLVPQIRRLQAETRVALAVSLHAPDDALRNELVPINRRHPIAELLEACWEYAEATAAVGITFEYTLLAGVNDSVEQARQLARLLANRPAKVNLIPFNPFPGTQYQRSGPEAIQRFRKTLLDRGIMAITRRTRGDDIAAACGQLAGQVTNRVRVPLGRRTHEITWVNRP
jgi:23S rRNA (adenine2503-C2)-methyltransferase